MAPLHRLLADNLARAQAALEGFAEERYAVRTRLASDRFEALPAMRRHAEDFATAVDGLRKSLLRIIDTESPSRAEPARAALAVIERVAPDVKAVRDSIAHADERALLLRRGKPIPVSEPLLLDRNVVGDKLQLLGGDGTVLHLEVNDRVLNAIREATEEVLD